MTLCKRTLYIILLSLTTLGASAQDVILTTTGELIPAKIIEVGDAVIKYYKFDNQSGPLYIKNTATVQIITYANGSVDKFNTKVVVLDDSLVNVAPEKLLKKGNNVFVEIPDEASRAGERYFLDALRDWGYWNIVTDEKEAHFIIEFNIDKKAMLDKAAFVVFKTRSKKEFKESDTYRASTSAFSGYNAFRAVSIKIVDKYFRREFK
jgi:hypothetical protein